MRSRTIARQVSIKVLFGLLLIGFGFRNIFHFVEVTPGANNSHGDAPPTFNSNLTLHQQQQQYPYHRPVLRSLLNFTSSDIIGDPQFLLDFAIIGFPKCGTTALQDWLTQHSQIEMLPGENFQLMNQRAEMLVWHLYLDLPSDNNDSHNHLIRRGYKNPLDIRAPPTLEYFETYFPKTLLIIGLRHPVRWFESMYNFKVQNLPRNVHPGVWGDPNELIGACADWTEPNCVGTAKAWFHVHLATLGKVPFPDEWKDEYPMYLQDDENTRSPQDQQQQQTRQRRQRRLHNPVFLYETQQLLAFEEEEDQHHHQSSFSPSIATSNISTTSTRQGEYATQFRADLEGLLKLNSSLPTRMSHAKPDKHNFNKRQQKLKDQFKIDICNDKYMPVRTELMRLARQASPWIRTVFLKSQDVYVSSPLRFKELLEGWMLDPCEELQ